MCQLKADCPDNNRCEADTSIKRTLRRKSNQLRSKYASSVLPSANIPPHKPKPLPSFQKWRVERLVNEINQLVPDDTTDILDMKTKNIISAKIVQLGDIIIAQAEAKTDYPAPKQADFDTAYPLEKKLTIAQKALKNLDEVQKRSLKTLQDDGFRIDSESLQKLMETKDTLPTAHKEAITEYFEAAAKIPLVQQFLTKLHNKEDEIVSDNFGNFSYRSSRELLFRDRKIAIINTLKELGVEFSDGTLTYGRSVTNREYLAAQNLVHASMLFPKEWVENSDKKQLEDGLTLHPRAIGDENNDPTKLKPEIAAAGITEAEEKEKNEDRPYYWAAEEADYVKQIPKRAMVEKDSRWKPTPLTKEAHEMKLSGVSNKGKSLYRRSFYEYQPPYENNEGQIVNPRPAGEDWEQIQLHEGDDPTKKVITYWTRPLLEQTKETEKTTRAQIVTQPYYDEEDNPDRGESVAAHEFFHRLTDSNHKLRQMQMAFLHTRAKLETAEEEPWSYIYKPVKGEEDELGYPASFNLGYAGKEYENWDNEIGTIGIESLFFGSHGGFISGGPNNDKADPEFYAFMVGMLATSIKK